jgi:hypothetical protein
MIKEATVGVRLRLIIYRKLPCSILTACSFICFSKSLWQNSCRQNSRDFFYKKKMANGFRDYYFALLEVHVPQIQKA